MEKAQYKRSKFGCLPGDIPKRHKIAMLEGNVPVQVFPWQTISVEAAKIYRRDHQKRANRRHRYAGKQEVKDGNRWI